MKKMIFCSVVAAAMATCANPVIEEGSVVVSQPRGGTVRIAYTLANEPAIVTVDILTNGVSIGEVNFTNLTGAVNRKVVAGPQEILWRAYKVWPDRRCPNFSARVTAWPLGLPPPYMVVNLKAQSADEALRFYVSSNAVPGGVLCEANKTTHLVMRRIPASAQTFRMQEPIRTQRLVSFTNDYYIGVFEWTQGQQEALGCANPSSYKCATHALETMSLTTFRGLYTWPDGGHEEVTDASSLGKLRSLTGLVFDVPTEAQWEYACRAGTTTRYFWGTDSSSPMATYASTRSDTSDESFEVGLKAPNGWGLYDLYGNVLEHTLDRCVDNGSPDNVEVLPPGHFFEPGGFPRGHSSCCTTRGGKARAASNSCQRNRVSATAGYAGNGFRLVCPALIP